MRNADCHTTRLHYAKGKCGSCYRKDYFAANPDAHKKYNDKYRLYQRKWAADNRKRKSRTTRLGHVRRKYGLTESAYVQLEHEHQGKCAICKQPCTELRVDHNHSTGQVRGLLCHACNTAIGFLEESLDRLQNAIAYLNKYKG